MDPTDYEIFVGNLLEILSQNDLVSSPGVEHLKKFKGKSGEQYEIDLSYSFRVAEAEYLTLIECKSWNKRVGRDIVSSFRSVIEDIGAHKGIVCTTIGFQEGAIGLAASAGIGLYKVTEEGLDPIRRLEGPSDDTADFLTKDSPKYKGGSFRRSEGRTTAKFNIIDYVYTRYGEEVAAFLASDEVDSIDQIRESDFKNNLTDQILEMGKGWIFEYLQIESCGMPVIVEPQLYFRTLNLKIAINWMQIRKNKGLPTSG